MSDQLRSPKGVNNGCKQNNSPLSDTKRIDDNYLNPFIATFGGKSHHVSSPSNKNKPTIVKRNQQKINKNISSERLIIPPRIQAPTSLKALDSDSSLKLGRKKAVVVGVSYINSKEIHLLGSANDAHLFAGMLHHFYEFDPKNIILLADAAPSPCYEKRVPATTPKSNKSPKKQTEDFILPSHWEELPKLPVEQCRIGSMNNFPTKRNILTALNWLVRDSRPDDKLVFYYAGHGLQVDNLAGWEGEGYDEAILPFDYFSGADENWNVLNTVHLKELLLGIDHRANMTIVLDCNGGQTILDPAGTGNVFHYIRGIKQRGYWPITNPTNKVHRARYDNNAWTDKDMAQHFVRPRYVPGIDVDNTDRLLDPSLMPGRAVLKSHDSRSYCFAGAPWGDVSVEALFPSLSLQTPYGPVFEAQQPVVHGAFTYCLVLAVANLVASRASQFTYKEVEEKTIVNMKSLKKQRLHKLQQTPELTVLTGGYATFNDMFISKPAKQKIHSSQFSIGQNEGQALPRTLTSGDSSNENAKRSLPYTRSHVPTGAHASDIHGILNTEYLSVESAMSEMQLKTITKLRHDPCFAPQRKLEGQYHNTRLHSLNNSSTGTTNTPVPSTRLDNRSPHIPETKSPSAERIVSSDGKNTSKTFDQEKKLSETSQKIEKSTKDQGALNISTPKKQGSNFKTQKEVKHTGFSRLLPFSFKNKVRKK